MLVADPARRASLDVYMDQPWLNVGGPAEESLMRVGLPPAALPSRRASQRAAVRDAPGTHPGPA